jgi:hypothetical protein
LKTALPAQEPYVSLQYQQRSERQRKLHASAGALCDRLPLDLTIKLGRKGVDEAQAKSTFAGRPHPAPVILDNEARLIQIRVHREGDPDGPVMIIKRILERVGDQLIDDETGGHCSVEREQCASVGLNLDGDLVGRTSDATRLKAASARWYSCNRFSSGEGPLLFFVITMGHNPASRAKFHATKM